MKEELFSKYSDDRLMPAFFCFQSDDKPSGEPEVANEEQENELLKLARQVRCK